MNLDQAQIKGTLYDLKDRYKWTGTQAQWDALDKSTLPQDVEVIVNITDDYDETSGGTVDVLDTLEEINANTTAGKPAGALAVKELNNSLVANSKHFYFDYKNGKYGYNTNPNRGADTFFPFSSLYTPQSATATEPSLTLDHNASFFVISSSVRNSFVTKNVEWFKLYINDTVISSYDIDSMGSELWGSKNSEPATWYFPYELKKGDVMRISNPTYTTYKYGILA